jgi:hypothetical protein
MTVTITVSKPTPYLASVHEISAKSTADAAMGSRARIVVVNPSCSPDRHRVPIWPAALSRDLNWRL